MKISPFYICLLLLVAISACRKNDGLPDLRETYSNRDARPFGGKVAFNILRAGFPGNFIQSTTLSSIGGAFSSGDTASIYLMIAKTFYSVDRETDAILDFVYAGNDFFLSAENMDPGLLNKIYCKVARSGNDTGMNLRPFTRTSVRLIPDMDSTRYEYFYLPFNNYFSELNENYCRVLGYNGDGETNFMVFFWGKGKLFLHTEPRSFSNYFLLKDSNYNYMRQVLQLMHPNPQHIYWNDAKSGSGKKVPEESFSTFSQILRHPPLAAAFWLVLALLALYVLFGIKRKQRIIRPRQSNENSSLAFTETIARLYLQQKDNRNIADKMVTYFNEFIRSNYFIPGTPGTEEFAHALSRKSGVPLDDTVSLYRAIAHVSQNPQLDDFQLLSLNEQILRFYKNRK